MAFATIVTPAPGWAACNQQPTGGPGGSEGACESEPEPIVAQPTLPALSPSDVDVNVTLAEVTPPSVSWSWPQICLPAFETGIPFVGFQPCI